ncbi:MAG TPA: toll/interleukin-1 receptor domain-containing protein [Pyrinomonadaceae bacterium]|nr:toll/interleukin-1 receptor domain-containing protein [Pyrinomonadaceae bacterium]
MANVFLSHRSGDEKLAEKLALELQRAGHVVWLDTWKIDLGDSIVEKINQGLEGAHYVVLCCSSNGVTTPWMGREWMSSLARQVNGYRVKVLPVLLTGSDMPAILADIKHADLRHNWNLGVAILLKAIK